MKRDFALLHTRQFDLLVCGGGIYGAWTAYDAALRGLKVAIVEQGDWASATSSASSKLIHGGLRYLESYDFKLVKKALAERGLLLQAAPHRVWPLRFGVPVYADSRIGRLQLKLGLILYDFLAGSLSGNMAHLYFNRDDFSRHFSVLNSSNLKGGFTYSDAQTDDARLVLELISGAQEAGAVCVNYCQLTELTESNSLATGAIVEDKLSGERFEVKAKQVVYAAGQWMAAATESSSWCRVTKGIHLILPASLQDEALLLTAKSDGRVFFMIPWYGMTVIGTTDTDYNGDMSLVKPEEKEISYLLEAANHYLKKAWTRADVTGSYAGLRVMKRSDKSSPSDVSRDWELKTASNGVHYSIGGKLTSSREDAASIVDKVSAELGIKVSCATANKLFPWAPQQEYTAWSDALNVKSAQLNIDKESAKWLIRRHGKNTADILQSIVNNPALAERITPIVPFIFADLLYCAKHEMVVHLHDLLRRRMPLLILARLNEDDLYRPAKLVAEILGWDEETVKREIASCMQLEVS